MANNEAARRWEARLAGQLAGYAEYRKGRSRVIFTHTLVMAEFEGRGVASQLARRALDDAVALGLRITPYCPFFRAYLQRHPTYLEHVDMPPDRPDNG